MIVIDVQKHFERHRDLAQRLQELRVKYPVLHHEMPDLPHEPLTYPLDYPFKT